MVNQCASTLQWLCLHALEDTPDLTLTKKWFPSETVGDDPGYLPGVCGWALRSLLRGRSQVMQMWPSGSTKKFWCRWFMRSLLMYGMSLCICMFTYIYVLFYDIYIFCFIYIYSDKCMFDTMFNSKYVFVCLLILLLIWWVVESALSFSWLTGISPCETYRCFPCNRACVFATTWCRLDPKWRPTWMISHCQAGITCLKKSKKCMDLIYP